MKRMLMGTVILIVVVAVFGISYSVIVLPLEYTTQALTDSYSDIASDNNWDDVDSVSTGIKMSVYYLAGAVVFGVGLFFVWFLVYAQKKEHERYYK